MSANCSGALARDIDRITGRRRLRRGRACPWSRALRREHRLDAASLVLPLFIIEGEDRAVPVAAMPGVSRVSIDRAVALARRACRAGIPLLALFPVIDEALRDEHASQADNPEALVCRAARAIRAAVPDIGLLADVALDPYTSHGHDGILRDGEIINDETVARLVSQALCLAAAGLDMVGPSDMMDGRIGAIREALDGAGYRQVQILAYSAKFASAFYGPFREALGSAGVLAGDKKSYQLDPANAREALAEVAQDVEEAADIVMVKPGLACLDILWRVRQAVPCPVFAYQVSGEYAMIAAAGERGWIDRDAAMMESLIALRRAGADAILTYFALEVAERLAGLTGASGRPANLE